MTLAELKYLLPKYNWLSVLNSLEEKRNQVILTKQENELLIENCIDNLNSGRMGKSLDWFSLAFWINKEIAFSKFKRNAIFRVSNYITSANHVPIFANLLLSNPIFKLNDSDKDYLNSVLNHSTLHKHLQNNREKIIKEISQNKSTIVKSLYSYCDSLFQLNERKIPYDSILSEYQEEEIGEAISYIISMYAEMFDLSDDNIVVADIDYIVKGKIEEVILLALQIKFTQENDIWIESFNYSCKVEGNNIFLIPPSPEFGKAYRLGNILLDMNRESSHLLPKRSASIYKYAKSMNEQTDNQILHWDQKWGRYVMAIPEHVYFQMFEKDCLMHEGFFQEEIHYLMEADDLLLIKFDKLKEFEVVPGLSFYDLLIIKRVFTFISLAYFDLLKDKIPYHYYNSNIPFLHSKTIKLMLMFAVGEEKVELFLDTFTFQSGSEFTFDMQYTPLLLGTEHYLVPYNVFINSNTFRNILFPLNSRLFTNAFDPIADRLEKAFIKKGFEVQKGLAYKFNQKESDIDLIAIKDNCIFIFECKNSVLPVNGFEFRSVYEQIEKAANKQLPLAVSALKDPAFRLKYDVKVNENQPVAVLGCVATTNRLMSGYNLNGFPIRNVKSLKNFISNGQTAFTGIKGDGPSVYSMWKGVELTCEDLINYLTSDTGHYKYMFDSMIEYDQKYSLGEFIVNFKTYPYDEDLLLENFKKMKYRRVKSYADAHSKE